MADDALPGHELVWLDKEGVVRGRFRLTTDEVIVGRGGDCDWVLPDPSVSTHHCRMSLSGEVLRIQDAGSTNGTFVNGERVGEAAVVAGQSFRLGSIELRLVRATTAGTAGLRLGVVPGLAAARVPGELEDGNGHDAGHDAGVAEPFPDLVCRTCGARMDPESVRRYRGGRGEVVYGCLKCGGTCGPAKVEPAAVRPGTLGGLLREAFGYPLRGDARKLLVLGWVVFAVLDGLRGYLEFLMGLSRGLAPLFLMVYVPVALVATGYYLACLQGVLQASANGEDRMPDWPEVMTFWDEIVRPFLRFTATVGLMLGPGLMVQRMGFVTVGFGLMLLGMFVLPMALLAVGLTESLGALSPVRLFSGIAAMPWAYLATCAVLFGLLLVMGVMRLGLAWIGIPVLPEVVGSGVTLYGGCVGARAFGSVYHRHRRALGWFRV
ncbi:MAG: FHA domain-containing protein [Verrucomicrobiae bacterium]|nr:FHA domain-containing protein [Verrucomicrobiae bacterium]